MGTTVPLGDVVGVTENIFLETVIPLQRHFDAYTTLGSRFAVKHTVEAIFTGIEKPDKGVEAAVVGIQLGFSGTFIG